MIQGRYTPVELPRRLALAMGQKTPERECPSVASKLDRVAHRYHAERCYCQSSPVDESVSGMLQAVLLMRIA